VQSLLAERSDPLVELRLEITLRVLDYLHPFDAWTLRTICKRWNVYLRGHFVVRAQVARLDVHDPADSGRQLQSSLQDDRPYDEFLRRRLRHVQSLRLGRPFTFSEIEDELAITLDHHGKGSALQECSLRGKYIAYLKGEARHSKTVVLYSIREGTKLFSVGAPREGVMALALSHDILVYVNFHGVFYTTSIADPSIARAHSLPFSNVKAMVADGRMVAILLCESPGQATIVLYDHIADSTTSFSFAHQSDDHPYNTSIPPQTLLLNAREGVIDIIGAKLKQSFGNEGHDSTEFRIGHVRVSTAGERISESIMEWWSDLFDNLTEESLPSEPPSVMLGSVESIGRPGLFCIAGETKLAGNRWDRRWSIVFDATTLRLY